MDAKLHSSERGQAMVYLVLGLIVFLGFVALAIDGGMALADRRHAQNGADASSLAGGAAAALHLQNNRSNTCNQEWSCSNSVVGDSISNAYVKAKSRADANEFSTVDYDPSDGNGINVTCGGSTYWEGFIDVTVDISATTQSNFLQLVYPKALHNEVEAVTEVKPGGPLIFGNAIVALNPADCTGQIGVSFHGTGDVNVTGGGVFSNGCVRGDGAADVNVDPTKTIKGNDLKYTVGGDALDPLPIEVNYEIPQYAYDVPTPDCPSDPGQWYTDNTLPQNMTPGLYCITGNLTFKKGPYIGNGVTLYVKDGAVTINGKEEVRLDAPVADPDPDPALAGILFYLPTTNHNMIKLNGTSLVTITGVIFAPGADIMLTGTDNVTAFSSTQFIGWNVEVGGTQETNIVYNGCDGYIFPPWLDLYK